MHMNQPFRRLALFLLTVLLAVQPLAAFAEGTEASSAPEATPSAVENAASEAGEVQFVAVATVALKVRRAPDKSATGGDSIPMDAYVYILELGEEWCKVRTPYLDGYVMTKYLADIREYVDSTGALGEVVDSPSATVEVTAGFDSQEAFQEKYYAHGVKNAAIYAEPDERSRRLGSVPTYKQAVVSKISGDWCFLRYKNIYGYVRCDNLFKWDRIDPYAGDIPGLTVYPLMAFVNHTTNVYSMEDNSILATINPGAAVCVEELDAMGRYPLPYWRTTGYIMQDDVAWLTPVVPYEEAQPGDLISVMTTYYAVGISTLQYQGRNWNIRLSSSMINGTVLQPGESYNQNEVIGPYRKSTGYHKAPIMSQTALWGYGGGTCQVNTTFYISTIQLPLLVTHRRVHADVGIYYAKKGFDAAVGGGNINLTMVNTLPYAIRYQLYISDGVLTCCIYRES